MTHDEKIVEAVARAIEGEIDTIELVSASPETIRRLKAARIARAAITAYQAEAWQPELVWTEPAPPNGKSCFYDHVLAETPFGKFSIEWKSWKAHDTYAVMFCDGFVGAKTTLDGAKLLAADWFAKRVRACIPPAPKATP
ncbi:hypothetical protein IED13_00885 [Bosea sp. SSUT16]|uniref:Uncharacterized protein n=1 Tax=Bosea spartocytisi TaxID=2773451 RepID=A0A927E3N5_9HYPH|nr:hypothetical protein [Bosea spartocytisi]MBD3844233.1 hypothetical protein [Bosea spartocytisi]MCT4470659.1 hypothetical protein [Bosea spartocytisi]